MTDTVIVAGNYGNFDPVYPQVEQDRDVDWIYVTDDSSLEVPEPWMLRHVPSDLHPRMAAKLPKLFPPEGYRYAIWINAAYEIIVPDFAREALKHLHDGIAMFRHPLRDCIYDEAIASAHPKYNGQPISDQAAHYRSEGHPEHYGLWETGLVAWDREHHATEPFASAWLEEMERWSLQDQLSFAAVCWRQGVKPGIFPHDIVGSPLLTGSVWHTIHQHPRPS